MLLGNLKKHVIDDVSDEHLLSDKHLVAPLSDYQLHSTQSLYGFIAITCKDVLSTGSQTLQDQISKVPCHVSFEL